MGKTKYQKSNLENSILSYLHKARASLKAVQIAKAVGMVTARDVNPTLYKLAKLNKVVFCDGKPPVWRLGVPLSEGASSQAGMGFRNTSGRWNVVTQSDNGLSLSGTADMSMCTSSYQRNYMPHLAGFHHSGSSVGQNACGSIVGGILTDTKVHHCHQSGYVMTSPGVKVKTHSVDVEIKAMSEKATCSTMFGQHTPMQQTLGSKGDGAPSQGGSNMFGQQTLGSEGDGAESHGCSMWVAQEQFDESSRESLEISGEDGKEVDNTIGQGYPGTPEGHCDMEVVHDTGVANMCQSAEIQDFTSSESSTEGKGLSVLNDQVRLLRALSTSDEQSVSSSPEDYSERFPVFGLNANFNISQSGCMSHDTDLQKRVLHCLALSPKQHCSTLHLVQSLQLGCKKDINAMLYDMSTHGLIYRVNDSPPHWQIAPPGQSLLQDRAVGKIPGTVASFVKCDSTSEAAVGSQMHQIHNTTHMSGAFRIPLSPAEMIKSGALYGPTGGATSEPSASRPLGVYSQSIVYHRIGIGRGIQLVQNTQTVGHTDSEALLNALKVHDPVSNSVMSLMKTGVQNTQEALTSLSSESFAALNKNPVSALMEFAQSRKSTATIEVFGQTGPSHNPRFRMAAVMGRRQFPYVTVSNKKEGKNEAAEVAVRILMSEEQIKVSNAPVGPQAALGVQATHFDKMAALCHQTFHLIISGVSVCMPGRKVMAGLVMKNGTGDNGKVISLGSGNRCITGESLSLEGQTVNDSHAEIITRRSFLRFLYRKLQAHIPEDPETIFEEAPSGKLRVKPGITFHLYITTAPCGDGALMSQRDAKPLMCNDSGTEHHPTFSSAVMGLLRTKIEGGEGTLPIKSDFVEQTWDGIVRGERLRTMSCSDKICRWNIVGMQGALLSHFLEPIYLSSLTLGYLYEESHLSRAVCCRLVHGEPDITPLLQSPYHVNHPQLGRVTLCDAQRETQKTKQYSVNWCDGDRNAEVTDGTRGICLDGNLSQVCKSVLYKDFKTTCQKLGRTDLLQNMTYLDAKQKATEFQEAKRLMTMKFKATGFGMWVSKPVEEKMFS